MIQVWSSLLFAHWPVDYARVRALVPAQLPLDVFDGDAWIGITPFELSLLRPRRLPLALVKNTPELNLRTYVTVDGKPGVYFFSLDINSLSAVLGARAVYRLPYYLARMRTLAGAEIRYRSERVGLRSRARFQATYRPVSIARSARPGTLEHFLVERYCLYTAGRRGVFRADIHHLPWPLQKAEAEITENSMGSAAGLALPQRQPVTHFSRSLTVLVWLPRRVRAQTRA